MQQRERWQQRQHNYAAEEEMARVAADATDEEMAAEAADATDEEMAANAADIRTPVK